MFNVMRSVLPLFSLLLLISCGGGSTVTAVSLSADNTEVPLGGSTTITAASDKSITENVTGEKVSFSFRTNESGGRLDIVNDRLDGNGQAKTIYRAGTRAGIDVIQATFDSGAAATVSIRVGTGAPVGPLQISQVGTNSVRITATDQRGAPLVGATVNLSISVGSIPTTATTNDNGIAEVNFTLPSGVTNAQVTATVGGVTTSTNVSTASTSVARINLSQRGERVQATALDRSGRPVPNVLINFGIRAGTVTPLSGTSDANGIVEVGFTLPPGTNSSSLTATSGGVRASITVTRVPTQVASIRLEQFGTRIIATVLDGAGSPVPGAQLNFRITAGTITPATATSNDNGVAEVVFTLSDGVNTARVMVSSGSVSATLDVVRVTTSRSKSLDEDLLLQKQGGKHAASIRLEQAGSFARIWLTDAQGHPVQGAVVQVRMDQGAVDQPYVVTNVNGVAEVAFIILSHATESTFTAEGPGVTASLTVH